MSEPTPNSVNFSQKTVSSFADFCVYDMWKSDDKKKEKSFVGIRIEAQKPRIYFPMGYRPTTPSEDVCKQDFYRLVAVLSDKSLQRYLSEEDLKNSHLDFPFYAYLSVLQYYLDFGYFVESETIYKKGFSGKISWLQTIKKTKPQVVKDHNGHHHLVYLNLITRKTSYREDNLITQIHKFCVKKSAQLIGLIYGVSENEIEDSELLFDYELFTEVIQDKIAATFNDKHLELFQSMLKMVRYLENKENRDDDGYREESFFGVDKFASIWEGMVDKIFENLPQDVAKDKFNPHLRWRSGDKEENLEESEEEIVMNDPKRSTLRPDTIMVECDNLFVLDSKYYKFGMMLDKSNKKRFLPGAESVCKQMAYAEYAATNKKIEFDASHIYNAFIMPYCAETDNSNLLRDDDSESRPLKMRYAGYIYGDWKKVPDVVRPYHKIVCILLDVKSVMQNYAADANAQSELAKLILR